MTSEEILAAVAEALQPAEELHGPDGDDYIRLMFAVQALAEQRIATYCELRSICREHARVTIRGGRPAYQILSGDCAGVTFYASDDLDDDIDAEVVVYFHPGDQFARQLADTDEAA